MYLTPPSYLPRLTRQRTRSSGLRFILASDTCEDFRGTEGALGEAEGSREEAVNVAQETRQTRAERFAGCYSSSGSYWRRFQFGLPAIPRSDDEASRVQLAPHFLGEAASVVGVVPCAKQVVSQLLNPVKVFDQT